MKAEEIGLNLSKIAENALKEAIRKLEAKDPKNDSASSVNASSSYLVRPPEFEPRRVCNSHQDIDSHHLI